MYIKINDKALTLLDNGITESQDTLTLAFVDVKESIEKLEKNINGLSSIDIYGDNGAITGTFNGYTKLLSISKDYDTNTISVKLGRPTLIIKGLSNVEEIKTILEKQGYTVE